MTGMFFKSEYIKNLMKVLEAKRSNLSLVPRLLAVVLNGLLTVTVKP